MDRPQPPFRGEREQPSPGSESAMTTRPDHGEGKIYNSENGKIYTAASRSEATTC